MITNAVLKNSGRVLSIALNIKKTVVLLGFIPASYIVYLVGQDLVNGHFQWSFLLTAIPFLLGALLLIQIQSGLEFATLLKQPEEIKAKLNSVLKMASELSELKNVFPKDVSNLTSIKSLKPLIGELWSAKAKIQTSMDTYSDTMETVESAKDALEGIVGFKFLFYPVTIGIACLAFI